MMKYLRDAEGKFATWVKVVGLTVSFLSAAVAYGKLTGTVVANTKTLNELTTETKSIETRLDKNELGDAQTHTELTITMENVLAELKEIKQEIKAGNNLQKRLYSEITIKGAQSPVKAEKKDLPKEK